MITSQQAVDHLYRVAVTENKATSTARLDTLAEYRVQEMSRRGSEHEFTSHLSRRRSRS